MTEIMPDGTAAELEALRRRLAAAEQVCVLYGWCGAAGGPAPDSDVQAATMQAWMDWTRIAPRLPASADWAPQIQDLANRRRAVAGITRQKIRGEQPI